MVLNPLQPLFFGLNLTFGLALANLSEDGFFPVSQSFCKGFLALRADLGSLPDRFPKNSLPFFAIKPIIQ